MASPPVTNGSIGSAIQIVLQPQRPAERLNDEQGTHEQKVAGSVPAPDDEF